MPSQLVLSGKPFLLISLSTTAVLLARSIYHFAKSKSEKTKDQHQHQRPHDDDYESLIGRTPMIHLKKLSLLLGNGKNIFVKMESMNPGGTGKDRAALFMLRDAEEKGLLPPPLSKMISSSITTQTMQDHNQDKNNDPSPNTNHDDEEDFHTTIIQSAIQRSRTGGIVVEGTSGSTGISLATLSAQRGHSTIIVMPDDQAKEKQTILRCLGAVVHVVPTAAISNPNQYVNVARKIAEDINSRKYTGTTSNNENIKIQAVFMNQFENEANYNAHISTTGPEIWEQTYHAVDAFCMSSGTGGTISGVGQYLKHKRKGCKVVLIDPPGSALLNKVKYNIAYASEQKERGLKRHRYDTIAEGIGLDRVTRNFALGVDNGVIDDAFRVSDQEAVDMAHWLLKEEGLFVGSSSAMNVCGAVRLARESMGPGACVVTVICDGGLRHLSRLWNPNFIKNWGLESPEDNEVAWRNRLPECLQ
jgi:cysteine synthase A